MIVKNEENILDSCLKRIQNAVDEIIIADTGSTDNTLQIASQYTDLIYRIKWEMDFSKARNFTISKATQEYILILDADELIIDLAFFEDFRKHPGSFFSSEIWDCNFYQSKDYDYNYYDKNKVIINISSKEVLFPNNRGILYKSAVHEYIVDKNNHRIRTENDLKLKILHVRSREKSEERFHNYNVISEKIISSNEENHNQSNHLLNLLHYYDRLGLYEKLDTIFDNYKDLIFTRQSGRSFTSYVRLIKKLFLKGQFARTKRLSLFYKRYINDSPDEQLMNRTESVGGNAHYYYSSGNFSSFSGIKKHLVAITADKFLNDVICLNTGMKKITDGEKMAAFFQSVFAGKIDIMEFSLPLDKIGYLLPVSDRIVKYPVIFNLIIENMQMGHYQSILQQLPAFVGEFFYNIFINNNDFQMLSDCIAFYKKYSRNFIFTYSPEYRDFLSDHNRDECEFLSKCRNIIKTARQHAIYFRIENVPICLLHDQFDNLNYFMRNPEYLTCSITRDNPDNTLCTKDRCYLKEYCFFTQLYRNQKAVNYNPLLKPIDDISTVLKLKLSGIRRGKRAI